MIVLIIILLVLCVVVGIANGGYDDSWGFDKYEDKD